MKIKNNAIILLSLIAVSSIFLPAYADPSIITAVSNKDVYQQGDKVIISGSVPQIVDGNPVTIIIRNPMGNVYDVGQVGLLNNLFVHDFVISDNSIGGDYTVNVKYDAQAVQFHFTVVSSTLTVIPVIDSEIKIRTNGTNPVSYGDVAVLPTDNKITVVMDTSNIKTGTVDQQYQIPKKIVDTPGGEIVLMTDGNRILCAQSETDTIRILDCPIPAGSKELELSGTFVIPEFGPLAGLAISISIMIVVVLSRTYKISF
ncbi:MAG: hypothetical protein P4K92_05935 [Candidatus Nitrosotalea sp.]|nr:hypothetical protein [Candidatus Nitrosotalea sp.]